MMTTRNGMILRYFFFFFVLKTPPNFLLILQIKFKKSYENEEEDKKRKAIYFENKQHVEEHNKKFETGQVTWKMGINQFSDLSQEEFQNRHTGGCKRPEKDA